MNELINTLESPGEFDALTSLRPGEPYFLLVGRDRTAPKLIQTWAWENRQRAFKDHDEGRINAEELDRELRKSTDAEKIGWAMESFKRGDVAPKPTERNTTVKASEMPKETQRRDKLQAARARTASAINHAVAELAELLPLVEGEGDGESLLLRETIDSLMALSERVKPWRPLGRVSNA